MNGMTIQMLAVAGGGALGALSRYGLSGWFATAFPGKFNVATLVINVLGSLLIGAAYVLIVEKMLMPPVFRQLIMVGFLGAFTTFSTFSLEALALLHGGQMVGALLYMFTSVLLSLAAVAIGFTLTQYLMS